MTTEGIHISILCTPSQFLVCPQQYSTEPKSRCCKQKPHDKTKELASLFYHQKGWMPPFSHSSRLKRCRHTCNCFYQWLVKELPCAFFCPLHYRLQFFQTKAQTHLWSFNLIDIFLSPATFILESSLLLSMYRIVFGFHFFNWECMDKSCYNHTHRTTAVNPRSLHYSVEHRASKKIRQKEKPNSSTLDYFFQTFEFNSHHHHYICSCIIQT